MKRKKKITSDPPVKIQDIAEEAGVSISTVSRVLNNNPNVPKETHERISSIIKKRNYLPNSTARLLRLKKNIDTKKGYVGVILMDNVDAFNDPYWGVIFKGILDECKEHGLKLITDTIRSDYTGIIDLPDIIKDNSVDGVIVLTEVNSRFIDQILGMNVPLVLLGDYRTEEKVNKICGNDFLGGYDATKYLINMGHKRIGLIRGDTGSLEEKERFRGYKSALEENGIELNENFIEKCNFTYIGGKNAMQKILIKDLNITAVFAVSDTIAIGAMAAIKEHGLKIPDDISIIGFDNIELSAQVEPGLTTVDTPREEAGRMASKRLYELLNNQPTNPLTIRIDFKVLERNSVKRII